MKYAVTAAMLLIFFIFIRTAPPTIYMGDSGEIVSAAYTLGIGHPPGYPLYMMCARIFSLAPFGDIAFRLNVFSAFLSAIVMLLLTLVSREFILTAAREAVDKKTRGAAAILSAAMFIFPGAFWFQGIHAKGGIYVLTSAVILISILCALKFYNSKKIKFMYLAVYSAGFMTQAHPSAALFAIFISAAVILRAKGAGTAKAAVLLLTGFITPYLYLFIRAGANPLVAWNSISGTAEVMGHIMRNIYNTGTGTAQPAFLLYRLGSYLMNAVNAYGFLLLFFIYGMYLLFKARRGMFYLLCAFMALNTGALVYAVETQAGFSRAAGLPMSLYLSRGFYIANDIVPAFAAALGLYGFFSYAIWKTGVFRRLLIPAAAAVFFAVMLVNYRANDLSLRFHAYDHGMNIMKTLGRDDSLFSYGDCPSFNIAYLKYVKKFFSGCKVYDRDKALLDRSVYRASPHPGDAARVENTVIDGSPGKVFYTDNVSHKDYGIDSVQYGILYRAVKGGALPDGSENFFRIYTIRDYYRGGNLDIFYSDYIAKYMTAKAASAAMRGDTGRARFYLNLADKIGGKSAVTLIDIVNVCYAGLNDRKAEIHFMKKICEMNPFDMETLDLLMNLYVNYNNAEALAWIRRHYGRIPEIRGKAEIKSQIDALQYDVNRM